MDDPRIEKNRKHLLINIITIAILGVICGQTHPSVPIPRLLAAAKQAAHADQHPNDSGRWRLPAPAELFDDPPPEGGNFSAGD